MARLPRRPALAARIVLFGVLNLFHSLPLPSPPFYSLSVSKSQFFDMDGQLSSTPQWGQSEYNSLVKRYWDLKQSVRQDEGRLQELNRVLVLLHNLNWE